MSKEIHFCEECGTNYGVQLHHIVFRSECKPLEHCKLNFAYLCQHHHQDHREGVHHNLKQNRKYKLKFQNKLEILWDKKYLSREDIKAVLGIAEKPLDRLLKTLNTTEGKYSREDVIRACMGGRLIIADEL